MQTHYSSGSWTLRKGREDEFIRSWRNFITWTREEIPGFVSAKLVRDTADPTHFLSLAEWRDEAARAAWWKSPGFDRRLTALRALCTDFHGGNYDLEAEVGESASGSRVA